MPENLINLRSRSFMSGLQILFFWPNIIGYFRLCCLISFMLLYHAHCFYAFCLYFLFMLLDFFDGEVARRFNQTSHFGAQLDIILDVFGRGNLWVLYSPFYYFVPCVEWLVFAIVSTSGAHWKDDFGGAPYIICSIMQNNFRSLPGLVAIIGLDFLPFFLLLIKSNGFYWAPYPVVVTIFLFLLFGRLLCFLVELYLIFLHIKVLI